MTRYHFHAADGAPLRDAEGEDLPSLEHAKTVAVDVMAELLPMKRDAFWKTKMLSVSVKDESGRLVAVLTTTATVDPIGRPETPPEY